MGKFITLEEQYKVQQNRTSAIVAKYANNIKAVEEAWRIAGKGPVKEHVKQTLAMQLENFSQQALFYMNEDATTSGSVQTLIDYGFQLITATMPNLISNDLVLVHPLQQDTGKVFYMNLKYGSDKGQIKKGDTLLDWQTGHGITHNTNDIEARYTYAKEYVAAEDIYNGDGTTVNFTGSSLAKAALRSGTLIVLATDGSNDSIVTITDNGDGTLSSTNTIAFQSGTINYTTGAIALVFKAGHAPKDGTKVQANYRADFEKNPDNIPRVNFELDSFVLEAQESYLNALWSLMAMYKAKMSHGIDVEPMLVQSMADEVRTEIDVETIMELFNGATGGTVTFDTTRPNEISEEDHARTIAKRVVEMKNLIYQKTGKVSGNWITAGRDFCNVVEGLLDNTLFKELPNPPKTEGPHLIGSLKGLNVYKAFSLPNNAMLMGYRGENILKAGYVFAPFLVLFITEKFMREDFIGRRGVASSYARQMINPDYYAKMILTQSS